MCNHCFDGADYFQSHGGWPAVLAILPSGIGKTGFGVCDGHEIAVYEMISSDYGLSCGRFRIFMELRHWPVPTGGSAQITLHSPGAEDLVLFSSLAAILSPRSGVLREACCMEGSEEFETAAAVTIKLNREITITAIVFIALLLHFDHWIYRGRCFGLLNGCYRGLGFSLRGIHFYPMSQNPFFVSIVSNYAE